MPKGRKVERIDASNRRQLLKTLAAGGIAGLAGCSSSNSDSTSKTDTNSSDGGGGNGNSGNGGNGGGDKSGKSLSFWHDKPDWDDGFKNSFSIVEDDESANVKVTSYGSTDGYQGALRPVLGTSNGPDLYTWWTGQRLRNIVDENYALDITDQWQKHIDNGEYNKSLMSQFGANGKGYAVPYYLAYWVVWYNKKSFKKLGLSKPKTWKEFEQICEKIKADGSIPIQVALGDSSWPTFVWFEEFLIRQDPEFYDKLCRGEAKYTDDVSMNALKRLADFQKKGYFGPANKTFQLKSPTSVKQLDQGDYVMTLNGDWLSGVFSGAGLDFSDMDWFVLPNINEKVGNRVVIEPGPIVPHSGTSDKQLTKAAVDDMLGPKFQKKINKELGFAPVNQKVDPSFLEDNKAALVKSINEGDYKFSLRYWENTSPDVAVPATKTLEQLFKYPDRVDQVAKQIDKTRQRVYK